ncbi:hypothetical protein M5F00_11160 [Acinetobacter sp. ANC 4945]|nr:hypothetical protein [Acinetobacter amyesii]MCL6248416.1 hypothetical protein [Acinetobacter amyesii]
MKIKIALLTLSLCLFSSTHAREQLPQGTKAEMKYLYQMINEITKGFKILNSIISDDDVIDISTPEKVKLACDFVQTTDRIIEMGENRLKENNGDTWFEFRTVEAFKSMSISMMIKIDDNKSYCPKLN